jgi:threonine synthase
MPTSSAFTGLACRDCEARLDAAVVGTACPECGGSLAATYEPIDEPDLDALINDEESGIARYATLLPFDTDTLVSMSEGETPAIDAPGLAANLGVDRLLIKDEGRNPTGAVTDRGLAVATSAAASVGAEHIELPTTGNGGQSAAAYAGRAGLDSRSFVPTRSPFVNKAMVNVHGGDMRVVEGRYGDAHDTYETNRDEDAVAVGPGSPYRREGQKTLLLELLETLDGAAPDAIIVPAGHGTILAGIHAAIMSLQAGGILTDSPRLYAVQPAGCDPIAAAVPGDGDIDPVDTPDTIVGPLEVAAPADGALAVEAVAATDGRGIAVDDESLLEAAVDAGSQTGIEVGATGGTAIAGARRLAADGAFESSDTVVCINPVAASKESDLLRSYLMGQGM